MAWQGPYGALGLCMKQSLEFGQLCQTACPAYHHKFVARLPCKIASDAAAAVALAVSNMQQVVL